ncbi:MAG TPA: hypothetical protein VKY19_17965 [Ktedonosporobacter sp.]|nr:hypothetical protein [Ktedonosporobacter sp.]
MHVTITFQMAVIITLACILLTCWLSKPKYGLPILVAFILLLFAAAWL